MPSLLLKRVFIRDCENEDEQLKQGEEYNREKAIMGGTDTKSGRKKYGQTEKGYNTDFYNF